MEKIPFGENWPQNCVFSFEKYCHWFWLKIYLNKNWCCGEFDVADHDLGFTTGFWISTIELIVLYWTLYFTLRIWNNVMVLSRIGLASSPALVDQPSGDDILIKIPYGVDVLLHRPALHLIFSYCIWLKLNLILLLDQLRLP